MMLKKRRFLMIDNTIARASHFFRIFIQPRLTNKPSGMLKPQVWPHQAKPDIMRGVDLAKFTQHRRSPTGPHGRVLEVRAAV